MSDDKLAIISDDQKQLWKNTFCKEATDDEFEMFCRICLRTGLSPEARQIYGMMRYDYKSKRNVLMTIISIDGFRLIANRSHKYAGQMGPYFKKDANSAWIDCWPYDKAPLIAKVGVLRHDFKEPLYATARWDSYCQKTKDGQPTMTWGKMPDIMLAKCAEALALRRAFPQELSGLYTADEMGHVDVDAIDIDHKPIDPHAQPAGVLTGVLDPGFELKKAIADAFKREGITSRDEMIAAYEAIKDKIKSLDDVEEQIKGFLIRAEHKHEPAND